jgi:hypothetical protein
MGIASRHYPTIYKIDGQQLFFPNTKKKGT